MKRSPLTAITLGFVLVSSGLATTQTADPLPSWNDGKAKQSIIEFVAKVTKQRSPDFVPSAERIAVFDNDGTLWSEQPMYFQLFFAIDRVKALAPEHPEWTEKEPFASVSCPPARLARGRLGRESPPGFRAAVFEVNGHAVVA